MSRIHVKETSKRIWIFAHIPMYVTIGDKSAYINILMFLGMVGDTSKDNKWSKGANESAAGQGKAIQCVIHLVG